MASSCKKCGGGKPRASHRLTYSVVKTKTYVPDGKTAKVYFRTSMDVEDDGYVYSYHVSNTYRISFDLIYAILKINSRAIRFMIPTEEVSFQKAYAESLNTT